MRQKDKIEFPSKQPSKRTPLATRDMNTRPTRDMLRDDRILQPLRQQSRSRTPSLRSRQHQNRPVTPVSGHLPQPVKTNSYISASPMTKTLSGSGTGHRNVKRAGHNAHWHVFRGARRNEGSSQLNGRDNRDPEPFGGSPSTSRRNIHRRDDSDDVFGPSPPHKEKHKENDALSIGRRHHKGHDTAPEEPEWEDTDFEGSETGFN
jgi:hypothetical protein